MNIDCSMYDYLKNNRTVDKIDIMSYYGKRITDERFYRDLDTVAGFLSKSGVVSSDSVAICLPNFPSALVTFYATNKLGAVANVIHPLLPPMGLYQILTNIKSKVIFIYDYFYPKYREVLESLGIKVVLCGAHDYMPALMKMAVGAYSTLRLCRYNKARVIKYSSIFSQDYLDIPNYSCDNIGEKTAVYLHSGGTTGTPKTVKMPNRALNACAHNVANLIGDELIAGDSMLMVLPMFHVFGLGVCMHTALSHNARAVLVAKFDPRKLCSIIKKEKLTFMTGVPSMYAKLLNEKSFSNSSVQSLKYCYCGGDKLKQDIINRFQQVMDDNNAKCKLCEGYGLTEATICTVNAPTNSKVGSVGRVIGGCKAGIFDAAANELPYGESGEICIGGSSVMSGYYNDEITTNKVLFKDSRGINWVRTGDIGRMDESGHLYFIDRKKRMLKISGINVFPSEIESVVYDSVEEVDKCCAVEHIIEGKSAVKLLLALKPKVQYSEELKQKILWQVATRLMKYSVPRIIEVRDSLPLTHIGKVDYRQILTNEGIKED